MSVSPARVSQSPPVQPSPAEFVPGKSTRGRLPRASLPWRDKSDSMTKQEDNGRDIVKLRPSDSRRKVSIGGVVSLSPTRVSLSPPSHTAPTPKRRSTMNSRDAAFEEEVKAALEASKREAMMVDQDDTETVEEPMEHTVEEAEDEAVETAKIPSRKGKRKREEEDLGKSAATQVGATRWLNERRIC